MLVGVPTEIKNNEYRVAVTPAGVEALAAAGQGVVIQAGAGAESGFTDDYYRRSGAEIVASAEEVWARAEMIMKVKEPMPAEWPSMRRDQVVFTYFHFAASEPLTRAVMESGTVAVAYETVESPSGELPLLTPMSEVAGRMAVQAGAKYLERPAGGSGVLLGGVPGVQPAKVLVLGGGVVGAEAAKMAAGLGARVAVMDISLPRLRRLADVMPANVNLLYSTRYAVRKQLVDSDLVVGAVLLPGKKAPNLVRRQDLRSMRPGSVIVDVAVDQGGCVETIRPTTHEDPVYEVDGVIHYGVANMPGAVPRSSTLALTNATLPYAVQLARKGWRKACEDDPGLARGVSVVAGKIVHRGVAETFGLPFEAEWGRKLHGARSLHGAAQLRDAVEPEAGCPSVRFMRLPANPDLPLPTRETEGAAGYDVRACVDLRLEPGQVEVVPTGLAMELPPGVECQVRPRSGLATRNGVTMPNSPGTIDSDYRGELKVPLQNLGRDPVDLRRGDRIAQLVFARCLSPAVTETADLSRTPRGTSGFGSTGAR